MVISALVLHMINNSVLHVKTEKYNVLAAVGMYERYMLVLSRNIAKVICPYNFTVFKIENQMATYVPDGYIVVYAIDDSESLQEAERILSYLKSEEILHRNAVIMVANKTDLVRSRVISTNGKLIIL